MREGQIGVALFDDQFIQDPYPLYERMHAGGPVHQIGDSGFHAVCTWDAINDVVARPEDFSSNLTASMTYQDGKVGAFTMGELGGDIQALATADDPAHAEHRKLLVPQLAARRINALEPFIGETRGPSVGRRRARRHHRIDVGDGQSTADDDRHATHRCARRGHRTVGAVGIREHPSG